MTLLKSVVCLGGLGTASENQVSNSLSQRGISSLIWKEGNGRVNFLRKEFRLKLRCNVLSAQVLDKNVGGTRASACFRKPFRRPLEARFKQNVRKSGHVQAAPPSSDAVIPSTESDEGEEGETEEEARYRNWTERGWAPWEELRTPEAEFAVDSLEEGDEETPVSWEAFKKLNPKMEGGEMEKKLEEAARKEEEAMKKEFKFEETMWNQPLVYRLTPPRDWPPPGWQVDAKELAFIREAFALENHIVRPEDIEDEDLLEEREPQVPRWEMFLKQYREWVEANKDRLEEEALEMDDEYYPGRRRTGEEYEDGMYELPFMYPGQHYWGVVTAIHLYEGAFVYFGGVHDGWIPIMDNDWYEIRNYIKVGMSVQVEVVAKRDPYRFRFPVEMRFVDPNIDDLIFRRFEYPPIFGRKDDDNLDEVAREAGRPISPTLRPEPDPEDDSDPNLALVHPFVKRAWQIHEAEEMTLDAEDGVDSDDGEEYEDWANVDDDPDPEWETEPGIQHESAPGFEVPTIVLYVEDKYMNLPAARAEREAWKALEIKAQSRGEEFVPPESRFERRVRELNDMHQRRWDEEREALVRDRVSRLQAGLPLEEPGRYADKSFWGKNLYDPREPQWRHDYWGDPSKLKDELRKEREPRVRSVDETVGGVDEDEDDLLDVIAGEGTMLSEEGVLDPEEDGFLNDSTSGDNEKQRVTYGDDKEDRGAVNGTATKRIDAVREIFDVEENDWNFVDESGDEGDKQSDDTNNDK
ncbi:hypothetical protein R1sor_013814 [Riccia sorocarpa]|uniref:S1 motif domain-containing protein n=1 Tax=Riccia sorocarpa TaxID=122646 RepID=A0ABD3HAV1_9MARC